MGNKESPICKFNQRRFCKFGQRCKKKHENKMCEIIDECKNQNCTKRHPQICRNYTKNNKCRFLNDCAYLHKQSSNIQEKLMEQMSLLMLKHDKDIEKLTDEVKGMKEIIQTLTEELARSKPKEVILDESKDIRKEKGPNIAEVSKSKSVFNCEECEFSSEKQITLEKHRNTKHMPAKKLIESKAGGAEPKFFCHECTFEASTKTNLKKHKAKEHMTSSEKQDEELEKERMKDIKEHNEIEELLRECEKDMRDEDEED
jgi:hypothetical protein